MTQDSLVNHLSVKLISSIKIIINRHKYQPVLHKQEHLCDENKHKATLKRCTTKSFRFNVDQPYSQDCNTVTYYYYSFKIFPRFGLVETTRIIHHNQLLFTKFGKNLRYIQSMTSKVEPDANYSTVDVKMMSKVAPAADYSTVDRKNLGTRL